MFDSDSVGGADDSAALVAYRGDREEDLDARAILASPDGLEVRDGLASAESRVQALDLALTLPRLEELDRPPHDPVGRVAVQPLGGRVPARDRPVEARADDRVERVLDESGEETCFRNRIQPPRYLYGLLGVGFQTI